MTAVASMSSIKTRDHAYGHGHQSHEAAAGPSQQVVAGMPSSINAPNKSTAFPPTLMWTPPSNEASASTSTTIPSPLSTARSRKPHSPPLVTPPISGSSMSFFARRGSLLPKSNEGSGGSHSYIGKLHATHDEEGIEMTPVKSVVIDTEKLKEEQAMAKWRKWVIEQPPPPPSAKSSPIRGRPHSVISTSPVTKSASPNGRLESPISPSASIRSPSSLDNQAGPSHSHNNSARPSRIMETIPDGDADVYNTESVLALRDVELAVDEDVLRSMDASRGRLNSRRMSVVPPPFPENNPFEEITSRLTSRRVRPIVLELVQALGHFIDAVWYLAHPDQPCPWAEPVASSSSTSLAPAAAPRLSRANSGQSGWRSKMVTAVQEARRNGDVDDPPTSRDAKFWEDEVRHGLKDADSVVGIYKGAAWPFNIAMDEGRYGAIHPKNVTTSGEHGGGLIRLLHDLEEALWGEAAPRSTDLAYELPIDFDPYAIVTDEPPSQSQSQTRLQASPTSQRSDPLNATIGIDPNGRIPGPSTGSNDEANAASRRIIKVSAWDTALNLDAFKKEGEEEVTLEELGRRRHQEWLESRKGDGWAK